jgi:hypothetical protein
VSENNISSNTFPLASLASAIQPNEGVLEFKYPSKNISRPNSLYFTIIYSLSELEGE